MWRSFYLFVFILLLFTESMITKYVCTYFTSLLSWTNIKKSWWKLSIIYKLCIFDVNVFSLSRDDDHWHPKHNYTIEQDYSAVKFKRSRTSLSRKGKQKIRKTNRPFRRKRFVLKFNLRGVGKECVQVNILKSLTIPKGLSESVYQRRTGNTMAKIKSTIGQTTIYKTYT